MCVIAEPPPVHHRCRASRREPGAPQELALRSGGLRQQVEVLLSCWHRVDDHLIAGGEDQNDPSRGVVLGCRIPDEASERATRPRSVARPLTHIGGLGRTLGGNAVFERARVDPHVAK